MIKNIIFDIGNVLMSFTWKNYINRLFPNDAATINAVEEAIWHSGLWNELDRNVLPEKEVSLRMLNFHPDYRAAVEKALANVHKAVHRNAYAIPWIEELRSKGYSVYFLSNYSPFLKRIAAEAIDFVGHMDGGVFSCDVKLIKPDKEIYRLITKKYNLRPEETVFLDDHVENIAAAREMGMNGIVFEEYFQAHKELEFWLSCSEA